MLGSYCILPLTDGRPTVRTYPRRPYATPLPGALWRTRVRTCHEMKSASRHLPLTLAALRWRWATSVSLLVAATLAVAASAAGPLYLSTADGTVLHAHLGGWCESRCGGVS